MQRELGGVSILKSATFLFTDFLDVPSFPPSEGEDETAAGGRRVAATGALFGVASSSHPGASGPGRSAAPIMINASPLFLPSLSPERRRSGHVLTNTGDRR